MSEHSLLEEKINDLQRNVDSMEDVPPDDKVHKLRLNVSDDGLVKGNWYDRVPKPPPVKIQPNNQKNSPSKPQLKQNFQSLKRMPKTTTVRRLEKSISQLAFKREIKSNIILTPQRTRSLVKQSKIHTTTATSKKHEIPYMQIRSDSLEKQMSHSELSNDENNIVSSCSEIKPYLKFEDTVNKTLPEPEQPKVETKESPLVYNLECTMTLFEMTSNHNWKQDFVETVNNMEFKKKKWTSQAQSKITLPQNTITLSKQKPLTCPVPSPIKQKISSSLKKDIKTKQKYNNTSERNPSSDKPNNFKTNSRSFEICKTIEIPLKDDLELSMVESSIQPSDDIKIKDEDVSDIKGEASSTRLSLFVVTRKSPPSVPKDAVTKRSNYRLSPRASLVTTAKQKPKETITSLNKSQERGDELSLTNTSSDIPKTGKFTQSGASNNKNVKKNFIRPRSSITKKVSDKGKQSKFRYTAQKNAMTTKQNYDCFNTLYLSEKPKPRPTFPNKCTVDKMKGQTSLTNQSSSKPKSEKINCKEELSNSCRFNDKTSENPELPKESVVQKTKKISCEQIKPVKLTHTIPVIIKINKRTPYGPVKNTLEFKKDKSEMQGNSLDEETTKQAISPKKEINPMELESQKDELLALQKNKDIQMFDVAHLKQYPKITQANSDTLVSSQPQKSVTGTLEPKTRKPIWYKEIENVNTHKVKPERIMSEKIIPLKPQYVVNPKSKLMESKMVSETKSENFVPLKKNLFTRTKGQKEIEAKPESKNLENEQQSISQPRVAITVPSCTQTIKKESEFKKEEKSCCLQPKIRELGASREDSGTKKTMEKSTQVQMTSNILTENEKRESSDKKELMVTENQNITFSESKSVQTQIKSKYDKKAYMFLTKPKRFTLLKIPKTLQDGTTSENIAVKEPHKINEMKNKSDCISVQEKHLHEQTKSEGSSTQEKLHFNQTTQEIKTNKMQPFKATMEEKQTHSEPGTIRNPANEKSEIKEDKPQPLPVLVTQHQQEVKLKPIKAMLFKQSHRLNLKTDSSKKQKTIIRNESVVSKLLNMKKETPIKLSSYEQNLTKSPMTGSEVSSAEKRIENDFSCDAISSKKNNLTEQHQQNISKTEVFVSRSQQSREIIPRLILNAQGHKTHSDSEMPEASIQSVEVKSKTAESDLKDKNLVINQEVKIQNNIPESKQEPEVTNYSKQLSPQVITTEKKQESTESKQVSAQSETTVPADSKDLEKKLTTAAEMFEKLKPYKLANVREERQATDLLEFSRVYFIASEISKLLINRSQRLTLPEEHGSKSPFLQSGPHNRLGTIEEKSEPEIKNKPEILKQYINDEAQVTHMNCKSSKACPATSQISMVQICDDTEKIKSGIGEPQESSAVKLLSNYKHECLVPSQKIQQQLSENPLKRKLNIHEPGMCETSRLEAKHENQSSCRYQNQNQENSDKCGASKYKHECLKSSQKTKPELSENVLHSKAAKSGVCEPAEKKIAKLACQYGKPEKEKSCVNLQEGSKTIKSDTCKSGQSKTKYECLKKSDKCKPKLCEKTKSGSSKYSEKGVVQKLQEQKTDKCPKICKGTIQKQSSLKQLEYELSNKLSKQELHELCENILKKNVGKSTTKGECGSKAALTKIDDKCKAASGNGNGCGPKKNPWKDLAEAFNCKIFFKNLKEAINRNVLKEGVKNAIHWQKIKQAVKENIKPHEIAEGFKRGFKLKGLLTGLNNAFHLGQLGKAIKEGINFKKIKEGIKSSINTAKLKQAMADINAEAKKKAEEAKRKKPKKKKKCKPQKQQITCDQKMKSKYKQKTSKTSKCKKMEISNKPSSKKKSTCDKQDVSKPTASDKGESGKLNFAAETLDFIKAHKTMKLVTSPFQIIGHGSKANYMKQANPPDPPDQQGDTKSKSEKLKSKEGETENQTPLQQQNAEQNVQQNISQQLQSSQNVAIPPNAPQIQVMAPVQYVTVHPLPHHGDGTTHQPQQMYVMVPVQTIPAQNIPQTPQQGPVPVPSQVTTPAQQNASPSAPASPQASSPVPQASPSTPVSSSKNTVLQPHSATSDHFPQPAATPTQSNQLSQSSPGSPKSPITTVTKTASSPSSSLVSPQTTAPQTHSQKTPASQAPQTLATAKSPSNIFYNPLSPYYLTGSASQTSSTRTDIPHTPSKISSSENKSEKHSKDTEPEAYHASLSPYHFPSSRMKNSQTQPSPLSLGSVNSNPALSHGMQQSKSVHLQPETQIESDVPTESKSQVPKPIQLIQPTQVTDQGKGYKIPYVPLTSKKKTDTAEQGSPEKSNEPVVKKQTIPIVTKPTIPTQGSNEPQASTSKAAVESIKSAADNEKSEAARRLREAVRAEALRKIANIEGIKDALKKDVETDGVVLKQHVRKKRRAVSKPKERKMELSGANHVLKAVYSFCESKVQQVKKQMKSDSKEKTKPQIEKGNTIISKDSLNERNMINEDKLKSEAKKYAIEKDKIKAKGDKHAVLEKQQSELDKHAVKRAVKSGVKLDEKIDTRVKIKVTESKLLSEKKSAGNIKNITQGEIRLALKKSKSMTELQNQKTNVILKLEKKKSGEISRVNTKVKKPESIKSDNKIITEQKKTESITNKDSDRQKIKSESTKLTDIQAKLIYDVQEAMDKNKLSSSEKLLKDETKSKVVPSIEKKNITEINKDTKPKDVSGAHKENNTGVLHINIKTDKNDPIKSEEQKLNKQKILKSDAENKDFKINTQNSLDKVQSDKSDKKVDPRKDLFKEVKAQQRDLNNKTSENPLYNQNFSLKLEGEKKIAVNKLISKKKNHEIEPVSKLSREQIEEHRLKIQAWLSAFSDKLEKKRYEGTFKEHKYKINTTSMVETEHNTAEDILRKEIDKYALDDKMQSELMKSVENSEKSKEGLNPLKTKTSFKKDPETSSVPIDDISPVAKSIPLDKNTVDEKSKEGLNPLKIKTSFKKDPETSSIPIDDISPVAKSIPLDKNTVDEKSKEGLNPLKIKTSFKKDPETSSIPIDDISPVAKSIPLVKNTVDEKSKEGLSPLKIKTSFKKDPEPSSIPIDDISPVAISIPLDKNTVDKLLKMDSPSKIGKSNTSPRTKLNEKPKDPKIIGEPATAESGKTPVRETERPVGPKPSRPGTANSQKVQPSTFSFDDVVAAGVTARAHSTTAGDPELRGLSYHFNSSTIRGRANIMAGDSGDASQLKGLSRYFNGTTTAGRANVAKATYASIGLIILYLSLKPKKKSK